MSEIQVWKEDKLAEIKKLFAPNLNEWEFQTFVWIWKATGLNPFLRELWAVKYWGQSASIFIWRDWYRKSAQSNPDYDYHIVDAVYSNDNFKIKNWEVQHEYTLSGRWDLIGAYCLIKRKGSSKPVFNFIEVKEYDTKISVWKTKPATMVKKVAEAQGLRQTFQELFAWTYDESEDVQVEKEVVFDVEAEFDKIIKNLVACENLNDLKKVFTEYYKIKSNFNEEQQFQLEALKNSSKKKIEEAIQEWIIIFNPEEQNEWEAK